MFTRNDLLEIVAKHMGFPVNDPRVAQTYDEMAADVSRYADDPVEFYGLMMTSEGPIATDIIADGVRMWLAQR